MAKASEVFGGVSVDWAKDFSTCVVSSKAEIFKHFDAVVEEANKRRVGWLQKNKL